MTSRTNYSEWTTERLIGRVEKLEAQLREHTSSFPASTTPSQSRKPNRSKKPFDPSKYNTRFIALKFAYLGQRYNGYEHHANNPTPLPTIEEELWKALMKTRLIFPTGEGEMNWEGCEYSKCGRTDKGVSAFGQVVGVRVRSNRPKRPQREELAESVDEGEVGGTLEKDEEVADPFDDIQDELSYPRVLNRVLPEDIRVLAWCPSPPPDFSARFSCRERRYRYFFTQPAYAPRHGPGGIIQRRDGVAGRDGWLDIPAMQEAAGYFQGVHDFRNFCKLDPARQITNYVRNIAYAAIEEATSTAGMVGFIDRPGYGSDPVQAAKAYTFTLHGSAFLWHQVRHMVAVLFLVGQGLEHASVVRDLLDVEQNPTKPKYEMADDAPLVLWDCIFPTDEQARSDGAAENMLEWIYVDGQVESSPATKQWPAMASDGRYGPGGLQEVLWAGWRRKKIDEILAGSLLDLVAGQEQQVLRNRNSGPVQVAAPFGSYSTKVFDGGNAARLKGDYTPIMERERMEDPIVMNARYAERKGLLSKTPMTPASSDSEE